ncbi:MAG: hypothetical protein GY866_36490 [Proteobacteria bacterium]|nr:hypothetical protein [Pseudomonadota bacterium]
MSMNQDQVLELHKQITLKVNYWIEKNGDEVLFYKAVSREAGQPAGDETEVVARLPNPFGNPRTDYKQASYLASTTIIAVVMKLNDPYLLGVEQDGDVVAEYTKPEHDPRVVFAREFIPFNSVIQRSYPDRNAETGLYEAKSERLLCVKAEPWGEKPNIQIAYYMVPFFNELVIEET